MNRQQRRAVTAAGAAGPLTGEAAQALMQAVAGSLGRSLPGCDVVVMIARGEPGGTTAEIKCASTADHERTQALLSGYLLGCLRGTTRTADLGPSAPTPDDAG